MTLDNYTKMELLPLLPAPTDEEVRTYYDGHKDEYFDKESLKGRVYAFTTEEKANEYINKIGDMGGMTSAIEKGFIQKEILNNAYKEQLKIESGETKVVGVNIYSSEEKNP